MESLFSLNFPKVCHIQLVECVSVSAWGWTPREAGVRLAHCLGWQPRGICEAGHPPGAPGGRTEGCHSRGPGCLSFVEVCQVINTFTVRHGHYFYVIKCGKNKACQESMTCTLVRCMSVEL